MATPFEIYLPKIACQTIIQRVIDKSYYNFGMEYIYITKDYGVTSIEHAPDQAIWHRIYKDDFQQIVQHHSFPHGDCFEPLEIESREDWKAEQSEYTIKRLLALPFWIGEISDGGEIVDSNMQVLFVKDKSLVQSDPFIDSTIILVASIPYWTDEMINAFLQKTVFRYSVEDLWGNRRRLKYIAQLDKDEK